MIICILIILFIVIFITISTEKIYNNNKKNYTTLIEFLSKNIEILTYHEKMDYMNMLKDDCTLFSCCQRISSNLQFNYVSFFKCNYVKNYVSFDFLFTMTNFGVLIDDSLIDISLINNKLSKNILNDESYFDYMYFDDINPIKYNNDVYNIFKERNAYKIYYKKIYNEIKNDTSDIIGLFFITYTYDYIMSDYENKILLDVVQKVKILI